MNADSGKIAVIATRLPYIDRRALSEAWFSALHLASDGPPVARAARSRASACDGPPVRALREPAAAGPAAWCRRVDAARAAAARPAPAGSDRAAPIAAARVRAPHTTFADARVDRSFRTSLTFGVRGERVALSLRRSGGTLHIVAVCRPEVAGIVSRALACADLYLRARGESVLASVQTFASETAE